MSNEDGQGSGTPYASHEQANTSPQPAATPASNPSRSDISVSAPSSGSTSGYKTPPSWEISPPPVMGYNTPTSPPLGGYAPQGSTMSPYGHASPTMPPYRYAPPPSNYMSNGGQLRPDFLHSTAGRILIIAGAAVLALALLGGVGIAIAHVLNPGPQGYLGSSNTAVDFIQWTEDSSHHLNGTLQSVSATSDNTVKSTSAAFTGVHDGSKVSITFSALVFSATLTGTLDGETLTLAVPAQDGTLATDAFRLASVQDYNDAVNTLKQRIQSQAAATQSAQATADTQQAQAQATADTQQAQAQATASAQSQLDQAVTSANKNLSADLNTMSSDVQSLATSTNFTGVLNDYARDWSQMQKDYQHEQADYANGCGSGGYNAGTVSYDAGVVNYDLGTIQYDDGSLGYDQSTMSGPLSSVQSDLNSVQADWQKLKAAVAADTTGGVSAQFSQSDVDTAVSNAQKQADASNKALSQAQSQGKQYDKEATQMNTDAQNLANSMHC